MAIVDLKTEITGNVWKILKSVGDSVDEDEPVMVLESMKMEIPMTASEPGVLKELLVAEGETVTDGAVVAKLEVR